jgi:glycyl-tRNA synthetase beta chain
VKAPRTLSFLLEIGCEEIPARFLSVAQRAISDYLEAALVGNRLLAGEVPDPIVKTYSTPRRLVAYVPRVLEKQLDQAQKIVGPPVSVAFDSAGRPTRAAEGFAAKNAVRPDDLVRQKTPQGEYVAVLKSTPGRLAEHVLPELLANTITGISFPKSMYWEESKTRFVRPIRWIVALLGEGKQARVIPFEVACVKSGDATYGHRALGKAAIRVRGFKDYSKKLRQAHVELDPQARRAAVRRECQALLEPLRLSVIADVWLEDWIVNSTEWPRAMLGSFEDRFLKLPREILITVMRDHQKYFAVENRQGTLQPRFVAVLNVDPDRQGIIRAGHERVLAARFTDAEFFWNADQRITLDKRQESLAGVTYQAELGSYAEKVRRMKLIAGVLCRALEAERPDDFRPVETTRALRAVELAKCDLTTQMVQEFPELQGVVGGLYARAQGESFEVADAIYDHYLPLGLEDKCPRTLIGAVVSLADKVDSVAAGFAVGHEPTGSSDPFALRRQANGIVKVLLELSLAVRLKPVLEQALNALNIRWRKPQAEVFSILLDFMLERLRYYLETTRKLSYDTVRAVLAAGWDPPLGALRRAEALQAMRGREDLEALSIAAKRIRNILSKSASASDWQPGEVDTALLQEGPEGGLYTAFVLKKDKAARLVEAGDYGQALEAIATLRPQVDRFFDKVLVMAEDRTLRQNRLRLLGKLDELFSGITHFAEIASPGSHVDASTSRGVTAEN